MLNRSAIETLTEFVGAENVLTDPYNLDRYSADALTPSRAFGVKGAFDRLADAVVRPATTEQVSQIVSLAAGEGIPLVPYGGGTGVMGGTLPVRGGLIVDMGRMNRILKVNATDLTAEVEGGVVLQDLVEALAGHGLMPGHDPYSVPIATVAGTISTNGVGYRAAAFGPMGQQVVALEVVLPDGRVLSTRPVPKYSSGPILNYLFIGSEGVFGIITKATIRVYRLPESSVFATSSFETFDHGFEAAAELLAMGIRPTLLDLTEEEDEGILLHLLFEGYKEGGRTTNAPCRFAPASGAGTLGPSQLKTTGRIDTARGKTTKTRCWDGHARCVGTGGVGAASTISTWRCRSPRCWTTARDARRF